MSYWGVTREFLVSFWTPSPSRREPDATADFSRRRKWYACLVLVSIVPGAIIDGIQCNRGGITEIPGAQDTLQTQTMGHAAFLTIRDLHDETACNEILVVPGSIPVLGTRVFFNLYIEI